MRNEFENPLSRAPGEELLSQSRKANSEDRLRAEQFERLITLEGWKSFESLLMARVQIFSDAILQPAGSVDGALTLEYLKGAMFGLLLARSLPSVIIEAMKQQLGPVEDPAEESGQ